MAPKRKKTSNARQKARTKGPVRLQRLLASAGFGSRRQCEELIETGRVEVDGEIVTKLGSTVDAEAAKVKVDGVLLKKQRLVYYAVNKPVGVVTTNRDPQGRPRVIDLVPPVDRVFPVGRLDRSSEGLILLTNDGELAQRLTHPKYGVRKVYRVTAAGKVENETLRKMRKGIHISDGFVKVEGAKLIKARGRATEIEIVLSEGKNREIRRIFARMGHKVMTLQRIAVATLRLGDLPPGSHRVLRSDEVDKLWASVDAAEKAYEVSKDRKTAGKTEDKKAGSKTVRRKSTKKTAGTSSTKRGTKKYAPKAGAKKAAPKKASSEKAGSNKASSNKASAKKKTAAKTSKKGSMSFLPPGESRSGGAVIGGDSAGKSDRKKPDKKKSEKKRGTKRKRR